MTTEPEASKPKAKPTRRQRLAAVRGRAITTVFGAVLLGVGCYDAIRAKETTVLLIVGGVLLLADRITEFAVEHGQTKVSAKMVQRAVTDVVERLEVAATSPDTTPEAKRELTDASSYIKDTLRRSWHMSAAELALAHLMTSSSPARRARNWRLHEDTQLEEEHARRAAEEAGDEPR